MEKEVPIHIEPAEPSSKAIKIEQLKKFKKGRDMNAVQVALDRLLDVARTNENIMEPMIEAFLQGATIQEVYRETLMKAFGTWDD